MPDGWGGRRENTEKAIDYLYSYIILPVDMCFFAPVTSIIGFAGA